ncbi:Ba158.1 [Baboon cytomegalovirus]|nr:Ba158.1 [Baboon cytomegalovirus]
MNASRLMIGALLCVCVILSNFQYAWGTELRCSCINYYHTIPWKAKCVYFQPKSPACDKYELIVYYQNSPTKTCVRVKNPSVFDNINEQAWFTVTKVPGKKQLSFRRQATSCAVVS